MSEEIKTIMYISLNSKGHRYLTVLGPTFHGSAPWFKNDVKVHGLSYEYQQCYYDAAFANHYFCGINANNNSNNNF